MVFLYITYHIKVNEPCVSSFVCITPKFNQEVNACCQVLTELLLISANRLELQIDLYTFPSRISFFFFLFFLFFLFYFFLFFYSRHLLL